MSKIHINMGYPGGKHAGPRVSFWKEIEVTEPKSKTKSRLKNKRKRAETESPILYPVIDMKDVTVTKTNWKGRHMWRMGK